MLPTHTSYYLIIILNRITVTEEADRMYIDPRAGKLCEFRIMFVSFMIRRRCSTQQSKQLLGIGAGNSNNEFEATIHGRCRFLITQK